MKFESVYCNDVAKHVLYELLRERSQEDDKHVNISHREMPTWEEHVEFIRSVPYPLWYLIYFNDEAIGDISLTGRNEIGIVLFRRYRGNGYGSQAVEKFIREHRPLPAITSVRAGHFLANINPLNSASIRMFERMGFRHVQNTYRLEE